MGPGYAMPTHPCYTWLKVGVNEPLTLAVSITAKVSLTSGDINTGDFKNTACKTIKAKNESGIVRFLAFTVFETFGI
jgi:hypothetical protein